jgi:prepilin peptidase CpaA
MSSVLAHQIVFFCFFALVILAAIYDISAFRIPNKVSLGIAALFPLHVLLSPTPVDWPGSLIAASAVFLIGFGLFARGMVGGGDVKLLGATALWAGTKLILPELAVMAVAGGVLAAGTLFLQLARSRRNDGALLVSGPSIAGAAQTKLPYGVAIAAGALYAGVKLLPG